MAGAVAGARALDRKSLVGSLRRADLRSSESCDLAALSKPFSAQTHSELPNCRMHRQGVCFTKDQQGFGLFLVKPPAWN